jgi:hypothetical protein
MELKIKIYSYKIILDITTDALPFTVKANKIISALRMAFPRLTVEQAYSIWNTGAFVHKEILNEIYELMLNACSELHFLVTPVLHGNARRLSDEPHIYFYGVDNYIFVPKYNGREADNKERPKQNEETKTSDGLAATASADDLASFVQTCKGLDVIINLLREITAEDIEAMNNAFKKGMKKTNRTCN